jgi:hypothetical protein
VQIGKITIQNIGKCPMTFYPNWEKVEEEGFIRI